MLLPIFCVVLLTFVIGIITVTLRFKSVMSGQVKIKYYRTMQGEEVPEIITKTSRCFNNMFEIPVLFYVVCILFIAINIESTTAVITAWLFVLSRIVHTVVHLTYNNVLHRMTVYWIGALLVLALWVQLITKA